MSKLMKMVKPYLTKKFLVIALSALLVVGMAAVITVMASLPALTVSSPTIDYDGNRQVTVEVSLPADSGYLIAGARFIIGFDPTVMSCSTSTGIAWNVSNGFNTGSLSSVDTHLTNLTLVWGNNTNISYTTTADGTAWLVRVTFTVADNAPAGEYPLTMSFPDSGTYAGNMVNAALADVPTSLISGKLTINPIPITFNASIAGLNGSGEAVFGTELEAAVSSIADDRDGNSTTYTENQISHFTFQWYRGATPIPGAIYPTYTPTADDIAATDADITGGMSGCILYVTVGASGNFTNSGVPATPVRAVRTAYAGTVPTPVLASRTTDSITLGVSHETLTASACQFKNGIGGTWQSSPTFTGLSSSTTYTFYTRVAQTGTCEASGDSAASAGMKVQIPVSGTLAVSDTTPTYGDVLTAVTTGLNSDFVTNGLGKASYKWYRGSVAPENIAGTASGYTVGASDIGQTITLAITANDDYSDPLWGFTGTAASSATSAAVKAENTATPTASTILSNGYINTDGFVISLTAGQEYRITQGGALAGENWQTFTGSQKWYVTTHQTWLKPATAYVVETRFAATATTNTGTVVSSTPVTSGKWQLTTNSLETVPASGWKYGTEITATGSTSPTEANASLIYQWYRDDAAIGGANTNQYTPVEADVGKTLKVELTIGGSYHWEASLNKEVHSLVAKAAGPAAPTSPDVATTSPNYITIRTTAGYQYQINTSNVVGAWGAVEDTGEYSFTGLSPNTTYYLFARIAETAVQEASAPSLATIQKTTKAEVGGSVSISVSGGGDAEWGKTLTANTASVTPAAAVQYLVYTWYSGDDQVQTGSSSSYVTKESDLGKGVYVDLTVITDCDYYVYTALKSSSVTVLAKTIGGTASITGLAADGAEWGNMLTAVVTGVTPAAAQSGITYHWSLSMPVGSKNTLSPTSDGPTYTPVSGNVGYTLTLTLGGSGSYRGTVFTTTVIRKQTITAKPTVTGTPTFGSTLSADLTAIPAGAQTNIGYQWYRSDTETGTGSAITGAVNGTYTVGSSDIGKWLYVAVTVDSANASYRGTTRSAALEGGKEVLTATVGITGTAKYGEELTATITSLTPAGATYDVIWYRGGIEIKRGDGAVAANKKYTLVQADIGTVISVTITGTGSYTGTPTAAQTATVTKADGPAKPAAPVAVPASYNAITVTGITGYAYKLDSGSWGATRTSDGTFDFTGLSPNTTYSVYCYIPETATHFASVSSDATSVKTLKRTITGTVSITGTPTYGEDLTANVSGVVPSGAQAGLLYAWYRGDTAETANEAIGVTENWLTLGASDVGKYIKVRVFGTGDYTGDISATSSVPVAKANSTAPGTPTLNDKDFDYIKINSVTANQYAITPTLGGALSWIDGQAGTTTFTGLSPNKTYYIYARVKETATNYASSACTTPLTVTTDKQPLTGTVSFSGTISYGDTLTAVITAVMPVEAQTHLTYQWYRVVSGTPEAISGATDQSYTIGVSDVGQKIRVRVIAAAASDFTGYVESDDTAVITKKTITGSISITGGAYFGDTLSVLITNVAPAGSQGTLTYQWQRYYTMGSGISGANQIPATSDWHNIAGATNPTYIVTGADIGTSGGEPIMLRVIVTGDGVCFTGSVTSGSVTPGKKVIGGEIAITGTVRYGSTVTASVTVIPGAADGEMSFRWFVNGTEVAGRTAAAFDIDDAAWIGKTLTVEKYVSAAGSNYTGSIASAGRLIGKTANPGTTVPVQVLSFDKTSITIKVTPGQIYSIDGGLTWTGPGFDGVFSGLTPGVTYTIMTKIPGSETMDDSATLMLTIQTQPDAVNVYYSFYDGITGTVIVPSRVEIGTKATIRVIAPDGYRLSEIFDSMPNGVKLTALGNDTFSFVAGRQDIFFFIAFTADTSSVGRTSSTATSYAYSVPPTASSKASSAPSAVSQATGPASSAGSDVNAPNMGENGVSGNAAGITIALFAIFGIAAVVTLKRKIKN